MNSLVAVTEDLMTVTYTRKIYFGSGFQMDSNTSRWRKLFGSSHGDGNYGKALHDSQNRKVESDTGSTKVTPTSQASQPPRIVPPAKDQIFKDMNLCRTVHFQTVPRCVSL